MQRAILLQTEATSAKRKALSAFAKAATTEANWLLSERSNHAKFNDFWHGIGSESKRRTGFNSQVVCDLARSTWRKQKGCSGVNGVTVKFNVPRNCKTFRTRGFTFVEFGLYPRRRVAVPIKTNRNWDRFSGLLGSGWTCKTYGLTPSLEIVAYLSKPDVPLQARRNILGIDINAKNFAYSVLTPEGRVLKQGYLGQHIWPRKHHFAERRAVLQSLNALKKLKRMRHRQRDYVETNIGQMVREIVILAKKHGVDEIVIERLWKFKPKGRKFNKKVMTIPFYLFRRILEGRCFDNGIKLNRVDAYHTSKWCSRCGAVGAGHDGKNYSLFRCKVCGLVVNSDRKASLAVAAKSLLERGAFSQESLSLSGRRVPVSGLVRDVSDAPESMAVPVLVQGRGKPTGFSRG